MITNIKEIVVGVLMTEDYFKTANVNGRVLSGYPMWEDQYDIVESIEITDPQDEAVHKTGLTDNSAVMKVVWNGALLKRLSTTLGAGIIRLTGNTQETGAGTYTTYVENVGDKKITPIMKIDFSRSTQGQATFQVILRRLDSLTRGTVKPVLNGETLETEDETSDVLIVSEGGVEGNSETIFSSIEYTIDSTNQTTGVVRITDGTSGIKLQAGEIYAIDIVVVGADTKLNYIINFGE